MEKQNEKRKAIIYCRVSTTKQACEGVSLAVQRDKALAHCSAHDYDVIGLEADEGISGRRSDNRPGLKSAIALACEEKAVIVAYSLSRFSRNTREAIDLFERLNKCGANLVSLSENIDTTGAAGKMLFTVMSALAQFESDVISERTKGAMDHLREQGKCLGNPPYGYDVDEKNFLVENETEQSAIKAMLNMRSTGHTFQSIATNLELQETKNKSGKVKWSAKVVRGIIMAASNRVAKRK